ncbi:polyphosphate kinase 1 [Sodalis sp. dw_96]|uniref:polyphosphate kinase 1 n=1 Tax=Sodalis sp. dw_96 TaxID=2719794 RepID=UPI001BD608BB|nr:polyphosphate kinase 1 [Sodalis sp. dw_96]
MDKELSWLAFNERVLQEAEDASNPLVERIRFLGIYSSNRDEFYKVRFADLRRRRLISEALEVDTDIWLLNEVQQRIRQSNEKFDALYNDLLRELARNQIYLLNESQISEAQSHWLKGYFRQSLRTLLFPILIEPDTSLVTFLRDEYTYLVVEMIQGSSVRYAMLEIPSDKTSRFISLPADPGSRRRKPLILLDNVMRLCLDDIFGVFFDYDTVQAYSMKMTRDAEFDLSMETDTSLPEMMSSGLRQRLKAEPVRLTYQRDMPPNMLKMLYDKLGIEDHDSVIAGGRYHNFRDFIRFPDMGKRRLVNEPLPALQHPHFAGYRNMFDAISVRDILLYYPYHTFEHTLEILRHASFDPFVVTIRINIYRVARHSRVMDAMIHAASNGKKVTVVVELQARFDEAANLEWSRRLKSAGVQVIFSVPGLKIHSKLFLISRLEAGKLVRYAHLGTGNFNENTARLYTDYALLTKDERITNEVRQVFSFIENPYRRVKFNWLIVSPLNARIRLYRLIDAEIAAAAAGLPSGIRLKVNNLVDTGLIERLYAASAAGVPISLLVRGMCTLVPGLPGVSDSIRVISILDRFLEHDRVYQFQNKGVPRLFLSSADWMTRNIDNRIEVGVELLSEELRNQVSDILDLLFSDTVKARILDKDMSNGYVPRGGRRKVRGQYAVYHYLQNREESDDVEADVSSKSAVE